MNTNTTIMSIHIPQTSKLNKCPIEKSVSSLKFIFFCFPINHFLLRYEEAMQIFDEKKVQDLRFDPADLAVDLLRRAQTLDEDDNKDENVKARR